MIELPFELELKMFAEKGVLLPSFTGYISRGLMLHMLRQVDPSISQKLHEPNVVKPYSVTPLRFRSIQKLKEGYILDKSYPCSFGIRFLNDALVKTAIDYFNENNKVMILDAPFYISSVNIKSKDFAKLISENSSIETFRLYFKTPTHFSTIGSKFDKLFPDPIMIFPNLMRIWDSCMSNYKQFGKEAHKEYKEWVKDNVGVSGHELRTLTVNGKSRKIGFVGWTAYRMKDDNNWCKVTSLLASLAEYSNIGSDRTAGFGVVRCVPFT
ncbi:MAG: CRISPR-associated endoribonuclease Cas6 [Nitrososphaerales archaeon]